MNRRLRTTHRVVWTLLAILLPALVALALQRRHAPLGGPLPAEVAAHEGR
jgi:hypothetical protein